MPNIPRDQHASFTRLYMHRAGAEDVSDWVQADVYASHDFVQFASPKWDDLTAHPVDLGPIKQNVAGGMARSSVFISKPLL